MRFDLRTNILLNAITDVELLKMLRLPNPKAVIPARMTFPINILDRLSASESGKVCTKYDEWSFISDCIDGWRSPLDDKWLGFCRFLHGIDSVEEKIDVSIFFDMNSTFENENYVADRIDLELRKVIDAMKENQRNHWYLSWLIQLHVMSRLRINWSKSAQKLLLSHDIAKN